jgi:hypothetical protein
MCICFFCRDDGGFATEDHVIAFGPECDRDLAAEENESKDFAVLNG